MQQLQHFLVHWKLLNQTKMRAWGVKLSTTQNSVKITLVNGDPECQCPLLPVNGPSSGWLLVSTLHFSHKEYCQFFKTLLWDYNIGFYIKGKSYFNRATVNCISAPSQYLTHLRGTAGVHGLTWQLLIYNLTRGITRQIYCHRSINTKCRE